MNELVIAFKNQGKSTLALWLAQSKHKPIIAYDPHEIFVDIKDAEVLRDIEELNDRIGDELDRNTMLVYVPTGEDDEQDFNEFCAALWKPRQCVILIDEASYIQTAGHAPRFLKKLLRLNEEKYKVDLIQASHRVTDVSTLTRSQTWDWYIGFTADKNDLEIIREKWGDTVADAVEAIPFESYQVVHVSATMRTHEVMTDSQRWYQPLTAKAA